MSEAPFFDTVAIKVPSADKVVETALKHKVGGWGLACACVCCVCVCVC